MAATPTTRRSQRDRSEATTARLVEAAGELFGADGYAATLLEDIVRRAGVTKGAVYHHFRSKRELFEAVFEREQRRIAAAAAEAYAARPDAWEGFYSGCRAYFEASLDPAVQRITVLDAPSVLGWSRMREIETDHTQAMLRHGLERAMDEGKIGRRPVEPLASMLAGSMCEGAMLVARSEDQPGAARVVLEELRVHLDALARGGTEAGESNAKVQG